MIYEVDVNGGANRTINGGVSLLSPGDTLIVHGGVYFERLNDNTIPSGCSILAAPGEFPVMMGNLWLTMKDSIIWDGISINGINNGIPTGPGWQEIFTNVFLNGCTNVAIRNCEIFNASKLNILVGDGNGYSGNIFLQNLKVHNPGMGGWSDPNVEPANHNLYLSARNQPSGLYLVEGCEIYNANTPGNGPNQWGCQVYGYGSRFIMGAVIRNNYFHDNRQGLCVGSGSGDRVYNNVLYNNSLPNSYGEAAITVGYNDPSDVLVANNTIVGNKAGYGISVGPWGPGSNTKIYNNILWGNGSDSVDDHGAGTDIKGNVFGVDPRFVSGFHLASDSPAIGAGVDLSAMFNTDIEGNPRPSSGAWDAGAYASGVSTPPPVQTKTCWDGSVIPIDQNCPPEPVQTKTCWDGSVIPIDQPCPEQPWGGHRRRKPKRV